MHVDFKGEQSTCGTAICWRLQCVREQQRFSSYNSRANQQPSLKGRNFQQTIGNFNEQHTMSSITSETVNKNSNIQYSTPGNFNVLKNSSARSKVDAGKRALTLKNGKKH